jgi:hypothetical protein
LSEPEPSEPEPEPHRVTAPDPAPAPAKRCGSLRLRLRLRNTDCYETLLHKIIFNIANFNESHFVCNTLLNTSLVQKTKSYFGEDFFLLNSIHSVPITMYKILHI